MKNSINRKNLRESRKRFNGGFTLIEMIVVITIVGLATTWALPQFKRSLEQNKVDRYTQNLESGLFNLKTRLQKASKKCTFFGDISNQLINTYTKPDQLIELNEFNSTERGRYLDCLIDDRDTGLESETPFRFLQREGTPDKNNVEVLSSIKSYKLNNLGANTEGKDIILRVRSNQWETDTRLNTRCIVFSGNGHLYRGTWSYTNSGCFEYCPEDHNCNGRTS